MTQFAGSEKSSDQIGGGAVAEFEGGITGAVLAEDSVLKNAPHTMNLAANDQWNYKYSRQKAVFPLPWVKANKFWPSVRRVNDALGDRNLICSCASISDYIE